MPPIGRRDGPPRLADYLFRLFRGDDTILAERPCALANDREAGVTSFILLRDMPEASLVVVTCDEREVARRARVGGKSELVWRR